MRSFAFLSCLFGRSPSNSYKRRFIPRLEQLEARDCPSAGLLGSYYANPNLSGPPAATRIDPSIDFVYRDTLGHKVQTSPVGTQNFSVVWQGFVKPAVSGKYQFTTLTDDGANLFVNGKQVIAAFHAQAATAHSSPWIYLQAGHEYFIRMEYFANKVGAEEAHLYWQGKNAHGNIIVPKEIIPTNLLVAPDDKKDTVGIHSATIGKFLDHLRDDPAASRRELDRLKDDFHVRNLEEAKEHDALVRVDKVGDRFIGNFLYALKLGTEDGHGSIIQKVTHTTLKYRGNDVSRHQRTFVEGWKLDKDDHGVTIDAHQGTDIVLEPGVDKLKIVIDCQVGLGLYRKHGIHGDFQRFHDGDPSKITWFETPKSYQMTFVMKRVGNAVYWHLEDAAHGIYLSGWKK